MNFLMSLAHFQLVQIITLGGFGLGLFYFTLYDDGESLREVIADTKTQIKQTEMGIAKTKEEIDKVKLFKEEVLNNKKVIKYFLNYVPETLTFTELSSLVNKQALSSGINIESKEDNKNFNSGDNNTEYETLNMKLKVSGSFSQVMFFLSKLTEQKRILIVDKIDLNLRSESKQIMSDINLLAYRYKGKEESEKKKE